MIRSLDGKKDYGMTVFDNYVLSFVLNGVKINNLVFDTPGQDIYSQMRDGAMGDSVFVFLLRFAY